MSALASPDTPRSATKRWGAGEGSGVEASQVSIGAGGMTGQRPASGGQQAVLIEVGDVAEPVDEIAADTTVADFQAAASRQGRQFAEQCDQLLSTYRFTLAGASLEKAIGVEIDQVATSARGRTVWLEYKGSVQGARPGLLRTDTLKKAIANGALMAALGDHPPYVVLTSHVPERGSGRSMLDAALRLGYFADVICLYRPDDVKRLRLL